MNKAIFLDRDGIINFDKSYVYRIEDVEWMPGIIDLIKYANNFGFKVIVLTNQSGIDRGYYKKSDVDLLHAQMANFLKNKGANIDDWFYCPDLDSDDRKPNPGMMLKAQSKYNIDLSKSYMIGDKESDIINLVGPKYLIVKGNYDLSQICNRAILFNNLDEILKWIIENESIS